MELTGRTLGHYRVQEEISRGGMGVVYRATDTRLNRDVALKVLPDDVTHDVSRRRRFLQEARAASALEHPNIAVVHEANEADGLAYIAMELIRGETLSSLLARQRLTAARALEIAGDVAAGLARAHDLRIVHRDLKPSNVMLTTDGHVKIIDFGIAKAIDAAADGNAVTRTSDATADGAVVGTVSYMSPEQARGDTVDHRSDIFALGILFHEMLAGQPPFRGKTSLDTANAILNHEAPRLPPLGVDTVPGATAEIQRIVDKCLAKDPANRYQGIKDLAVDVRALGRRLDTGTNPATARPARTRTLALVTGSIMLIAAGLLWISSGREPVTRPSSTGAKPTVAVLYFDNATGDQSLDWMRTGITEMLVTDLSQSGDLEIVGTDRLYGILEELKRQDDRVLSPDVVRVVAERTGVDRVVVGSYVRSGAAIRINARLQDARSGRIETSERVDGADSTLFSMVDELTTRLRSKFGGLAPATALLSPPGSGADGKLDVGLNVLTASLEAYRLYAEGIFLHERSRSREAGEQFRRAIAIDPKFGMAYAKLAVIENNLGHFDLRDQFAAQALALAEHLTPRERYYIEGFHLSNRLATLPQAIESYQRCVGVAPGDQACRQNLGIIYSGLERFQEAADQFEQLVRRGTTYPGTHDQLATAYLAMGQDDRALAVATALVARNPDNATANATLGRIYVGVNRLDDALKAFDQASLLDRANVNAAVGRAVALVMREDWATLTALADALTKSGDTGLWLGALIHHTASLFRGRGAESAAWGERAAHAYQVPGARTANGHEAATRAYLALGRGPQAAQSATLAVADGANTTAESGARTVQVWALSAAGRRVESDAALTAFGKTVSSLAPARDGRDVNVARGLAALARGEADAAIPFLQQAQAALPARGSDIIGQYPHVLVWASLGRALFEAGRPADALPWFERVAGSGFERARQPVEFVRSFYFLGRIHEQHGDMTKARESYRRFVGYWKDGDLDRERVAEALKKIAN